MISNAIIFVISLSQLSDGVNRMIHLNEGSNHHATHCHCFIGRAAALGSARLGPYTREIGVKGFICIFGTFIGRVIDGVMAERTAFAKEER